jgi:hypothetical protein
VPVGLEALSGAAAAATVLLVVHHRKWFLRAVRRRTGPLTDCSGCHQPLDPRKAVTRTTHQAMPDGFGGTAMVAEYHRRCARRAGVLD